MFPSVSVAQPQPAAIRQAADILRRGGLVAFPTETVYGLGADAANPQALARLYQVKGRPPSHPVIVHLASVRQLADWATDIPPGAHQLADAFWPGPLTLILPRAAQVPDAATGGQDTVGLRVPHHPVALALLQEFGGGIAAPSANRFGRISPTTAAHVQADLGPDADLILDGGACPVGVESTIVAFAGGEPVILRPGMITPAQIAETLGRPVRVSGQATPVRAPGTLASHYAPRTPLDLCPAHQLEAQVRAAREAGEQVGVMAFSPCPAVWSAESAIRWVEMPAEPEPYARQLYATLRQLDGLALARILAETVPPSEAWSAVADRLQRAAYRT